ncbi:Ig-like domain-containing protein [[Mycoplasma] testudinis]|uniref:Ig-like domain-containing protein n=1 Tax=[Mycoplasma] testudinis TaxID=33924 RepID=UPI00069874DB|nr:hypothetical protein [[Mycoplasma] testudinis]
MKKFKRPKLLLGILAGVIVPPISAIAIACSQAAVNPNGNNSMQEPTQPGNTPPGNTPIDQATKVKATFSEDKSTLTLGNNQLQRVFSLINNKVVTKSVTNHLTSTPTTFEFGNQTQEFSIHLMGGFNSSLSFIDSNSLTLSKEPEITQTDNGVKITFSFNPVNALGVPYTIQENVWIDDGDSFIRKDLTITVPTEMAANAKIDYIDLDIYDFGKLGNTYNIITGQGGDHWSIPKQNDNPDMANMKGQYLELGQPFYAKAMYFGSEFPMTENKILNNNGDSIGVNRYFYGKSLAADPDFNYNDNNQTGTRKTWATVMGAATADNYKVIQQDFYKYIRSISTKVDFRAQFNSWYDNMKNITPANIKESFNEVEHGFSNYGVRPLDSYVIDDGWTDYNTFWGINDKFNHTFEPSSTQVKALGSNFGLWLGPRGGYGTESQIARAIANLGEGSVNGQSGNDIDVSDGRYLNKLESDIFLKYQKDYGINYWKLDGMLLNPSTATDHHHVVGGSNIEGTASGFYTISETYERWTDIFEKMRQDNPKVWINLTSYANPSPWLLRWVDSVWIQNSGDSDLTDHAYPSSVVAQNNGSTTANQMEMELNYRDQSYFNFVEQRQWQLPLQNFYNHDPVYAKTMFASKGKYQNVQPNYSPAELRTYLYMLGTRGNAFWEFYYSPSLFTEGHWMVNAEAVNWIEDNYSILSNSHRIGGQPINGDVYGYSAWSGDNGVISLINPNNVQQTYDLKFDDVLGLTPGTTGLYRTVILGSDSHVSQNPVSYGADEKVTLNPGESLIWQFSKTQDKTAPTVTSAKTNNNGTKIRVQFSERIKIDNSSSTVLLVAGSLNPSDFTIAGNSVTSANLLDDLRTVELTLGSSLSDGQSINLGIKGVSDSQGNVIGDLQLPVTSYFNDVINALGSTQTVNAVSGITDTTMTDGSSGLQLANVATTAKDSHSVSGSRAFSIYFDLETTSKNTTLLNQDNQYNVKIDDAGKLVFTVGNQTITSSTVVNDNTQRKFVLVRENNGLVRIYVNGTIDASGFDQASGIVNLTPGSITLGSSTFSGKVGGLTIVNHSIPFDQVAAMSLTGTRDLAAGLTPTAVVRSTGAAAHVNPDRPLNLITDGNNDTDNSYGEFGTDGTRQSEYVQIDLGQETDVSNIHMVRYYKDGRTYDATVVATSDSADFSSPTIFYNSDTNNVHGFNPGTNPEYAETSSGMTWNAPGDKAVRARYVRVYMYGVKSLPNGGSPGTTNHIVTLNVNGVPVKSSTDYNAQIVSRLTPQNA